MELISASCTDKEERYHVKAGVEYILHFNKVMGVTQVIPLGGEIDKEVLKQIMEKIDNFRLSLVEESLTMT